jgi:hypothetical protein
MKNSSKNIKKAIMINAMMKSKKIELNNAASKNKMGKIKDIVTLMGILIIFLPFSFNVLNLKKTKKTMIKNR